MRALSPHRPVPARVLALAACSGESGAGTATGNAAAVAGAPAPAGQNWAETVAKTPEGGFRMGNSDAPVKLVEYGARTCPTCATTCGPACPSPTTWRW